jgi:hypothetical protein
VWTGYYGDQAPSVAASRGTMFNVASITKTVAAETVLRLAHESRSMRRAPSMPAKLPAILVSV